MRRVEKRVLYGPAIRRALLVALFAVLAASWAAGADEAKKTSVPDSPEKTKPLAVGDKVPKVTLKTVDGKDFDLSAAIAKQPTILIFYRGGW